MRSVRLNSCGSVVTPKASNRAAPTAAMIAHAAIPRCGAIATSEAPVPSAPPHQKKASGIQLTAERRGNR